MQNRTTRLDQRFAACVAAVCLNERPRAKEEKFTISVVRIPIPFESVLDKTVSKPLQHDDTSGTNPLNEVIKTQQMTFVERCGMWGGEKNTAVGVHHLPRSWSWRSQDQGTSCKLLRELCDAANKVAS